MRRTPARIHLQNAAHTLITSETAKHLPLETGGVLLGYREDPDRFLVRPRTVEAIIETLSGAAEGRVELLRDREALSRYAVEHWSWEKTAAIYVGLFDQAIERAGGN